MDVTPGNLALHQPLLTIQTQRGGKEWMPLKQNGVAVDDQGYDLQIRHIDNLDHGMARYELRWHRPHPAAPQQHYRFAVAPRGPFETFHSPAFR